MFTVTSSPWFSVIEGNAIAADVHCFPGLFEASTTLWMVPREGSVVRFSGKEAARARSAAITAIPTSSRAEHTARARDMVIHASS
jgi:hypothetical protein